MEITGVVESIIFKSEDSDFVIANFQKVGGNEVVVKGNIGGFREDSLLTLSVEKQLSSYGEQYVVNKVYISKPYDASVYPMYLKANFEDIGDIRSLKIYNHFKEDMVNVLDNNPSAIDDVSGITKKAKESIKNNWINVRKKEGITHDFINTMYDLGFSIAKVNRAIKVFQKISINDLIKNPYILITYGDIPFNIVDSFALKIGIDKNSPNRLLAGIEFYSINLLEQGDCYMNFDVLYKNLTNYLTDNLDVLLEYLDKAEKNNIIKTYDYENKTIVMPSLYDDKENDIAIKIDEINMTYKASISVSDLDTLIDGLVVKGIKSFNSLQKEAISSSITEPISIITGGPGTGKTTVLKGLVKANQSIKDDVKICLLAPTGKAAKRIEESTGLVAKTIHRELYSIGESGLLDYDIIVVDESSMIDLTIMHWLFMSIKQKTRIVLIGDYDQLEPVGEGKVFEDLILSNKIKTTTLNKGYRYGHGLIQENAFNVNNSRPLSIPDNEDKNSDFYFMSFKKNDDFYDYKLAKFVTNLFCHHLKDKKGIDPVKDAQVMVPMRKGAVGSNELNKKIQNEINPFTNKSNQVIFGDKLFRKGDKVIQVENNYTKGVYNGDIGYIHNINNKNKEIIIKFQDLYVEYKLKELDQIQLAYVITIHKSQGSEFPYVIMPLTMSFYHMLTRKIIYTGITRGKSMVFIAGDSKAVDLCISNNNAKQRKTVFSEKIKNNLLKKEF